MVAQYFNSDTAERSERSKVPELGPIHVVDDGVAIGFLQFHSIMIASARHKKGDFVMVQLGLPQEGLGAYVPLNPRQARDIAGALNDMADMVETMEPRP